MGARWVKTVVCAVTLACTLPSGILLAHLRREASACHRLTPLATHCHDSQNVEARHSHRLTARLLTATQTQRVKRRAVAALRAAARAPARPHRRTIPAWRPEPPTEILHANWAEPPLRAP